jgi:pimeloyl-ACP methyl ester carboxylesterase
MLAQCGHAPMMERPVEFNAALQAYLAAATREMYT